MNTLSTTHITTITRGYIVNTNIMMKRVMLDKYTSTLDTQNYYEYINFSLKSTIFTNLGFWDFGDLIQIMKL